MKYLKALYLIITIAVVKMAIVMRNIKNYIKIIGKDHYEEDMGVISEVMANIGTAEERQAYENGDFSEQQKATLREILSCHPLNSAYNDED